MRFFYIFFWVFLAVFIVCFIDSFTDRLINIYGGGMPSFNMWVVVVLEKVVSFLSVIACSYAIYKKSI